MNILLDFLFTSWYKILITQNIVTLYCMYMCIKNENILLNFIFLKD
jgi:hypothetical protein